MRRPSYPAVMSTLAMVIALSGGAYAFSVPRNSVGTPQLKNSAVTTKKLANDAVKTEKLAPGSVTALDIALGAVGSDAIGTEAVGSDEIGTNAVDSNEIAGGAVGVSEIGTNGVDSDEIASSAVGAPEIGTNAVGGDELSFNSVSASHLAESAKKVFGLSRHQSANASLPTLGSPSGGFGSATIDCPPSKVAVGGGFYVTHTDIEVVWSYAIDNDTWMVQARNPTSNTDRAIVAHVICVNG